MNPSDYQHGFGLLDLSQLDVRTAVEEITPEQAQQVLHGDCERRAPHGDRVRRLAQVMVGDEWDPERDSIKLAFNGEVLDGRHRLSAIVAAGVPVRCEVVRGLPPRLDHRFASFVYFVERDRP